MDEEPLVRVLNGRPAPEDLAALMVVLAARAPRPDSRRARAGVSPWTRSARPGAGPSSWRGSGLPR